ncbi:MAG: hypothetical protein KatS3mg006_2281 [Pyrinomonadaceae bacterium]|nr:MAG: hypothetical protein KatS3mg006_2281 [Pyrinomonadaceae bacterium]
MEKKRKILAVCLLNSLITYLSVRSYEDSRKIHLESPRSGLQKPEFLLASLYDEKCHIIRRFLLACKIPHRVF